MITLRRGALVAALAGVTVLGAVTPAAVVSAHTETTFVAVPAGSTAEIGFTAQHGCDGSPTVEVRVQAPVAGATAVEKSGWTAAATDDGSGRTVLQWTGGSLPADQAGTFEVEFTVPDAVGSLLAFPAVQTCANGAQETWIETEPGAASPAPQVLVLAAAAAPAATIDDVAPDAPGRDQLAAILSGEPIHDDAATATSAAATTAAPPTSATPAAATTVPASTGVSTTTATLDTTASSAPVTTVADADDSGGSGWLIWVVIPAAVIVIGGGISAVLTWRNRATPPDA